MTRVLEVVQAGHVPYAEALDWQRRLATERIAGQLDRDLLLLLEHPPVITLGRGAQQQHVIRADGVDVVEVERGGDVTYHGPGQLVGYPIMDLRGAGLKQDLHWYLRTLEQALIEGLALLDLPAERRQDYTGVWVRGRKIASIGVHVKQWVTWHGFALNVTTDLAAFDRIVPCGIPGVVMTSVERQAPNAKRQTLWQNAVEAVVRGFEVAFGMTAVRAEIGSGAVSP